MSDLKWTDQPSELNAAQNVTDFNMKVGDSLASVQVLRNGDIWYFTSGNLFGSQTLRASSPEAVFQCLGALAGSGGKGGRSLPDGCELLPNSEGVA